MDSASSGSSHVDRGLMAPDDSRGEPIIPAGGTSPMGLDRREFLAALGAGLAAPVLLRAAARPKRYPIAFSTLGCPAWSWTTVLDQAERLGYSAIELRGVAGEMDLPKVPELTGSRLADSRREVAARGLV